MARDTRGSGEPEAKPTRKPGTLGGKMDAEFRGYVNLNLSDTQKASYDKWAAGAHIWAQLEASVTDGIQLSLKLDPKGDGFLASATQRRVGSPNAGLVVTARGRDATTAWGRCLYCLNILTAHERWEDTQPVANPDRW